MPWKNKAIEIKQRPDVDYYFFVDESGEHILKNFDTKRPVFTVAGVLISKEEYNSVKKEIDVLKLKYWTDGRYKEKEISKKVCLISRSIRRRQKAFSKHYLNDLKYDEFVNDLSKLIESLDFTIVASCIDKIALVSQYNQPSEPYALAMEFIVERLSRFLDKENKTSLIMMEARGKKEDGFLHQEFLEFFNNGTAYLSSKIIQRTITGGFYFNTKWKDDNQDTYIGLELADLIAHPIGHFALKTEKTKAFYVIENKFLGYENYMGKGLKIFP